MPINLSKKWKPNTSYFLDSFKRARKKEKVDLAIKLQAISTTETGKTTRSTDMVSCSMARMTTSDWSLKTVETIMLLKSQASRSSNTRVTLAME